MNEDNKNKTFPKYEEPAYLDVDKTLTEAYAEFETAFDKMEALQEKNISERISIAEKKLDIIEEELSEFLKA